MKNVKDDPLEFLNPFRSNWRSQVETSHRQCANELTQEPQRWPRGDAPLHYLTPHWPPGSPSHTAHRENGAAHAGRGWGWGEVQDSDHYKRLGWQLVVCLNDYHSQSDVPFTEDSRAQLVLAVNIIRNSASTSPHVSYFRHSVLIEAYVSQRFCKDYYSIRVDFSSLQIKSSWIETSDELPSLIGRYLVELMG